MTHDARDIPALLANAKRAFAGLPDDILELGRVFEAAGEEIALVGGPVRDAFLGVAPHDFDLTTSAPPERTEELLALWGQAVWDVGKEFGTIGGRRGATSVEVTTYRSDTYEVGSRKPEVSFGDSLEGDLTRRDFTVNAMAMRLPSMALVDPHHGLEDLAQSRLRTPVTAEQSFDDDPLRIMRAARFAAQLGIDVDLDVMEAMEAMAPRLKIVSAERIRAELERLIVSPFPRRGLELMVHTGVAAIVLPEVAELVSTVDEHKRHKDVYEHTLTVLEQAMDLETGPDGAVPAPDFVLRFAALMHDVGKPATRRFEGGSVSFHHHEIVGAKLTRKRMRALKFDKATTEAVAGLVALHLRFHGYGEAAWTDSAVRRYVADAGDLLERLHRLTRADCTTRNRRKALMLSAAYDDLESRIAALREQEELDAIRPDLDGDQIMEILGLRPSRAVKMARDHLLELRMERGPLGEEGAKEALLAWWSSPEVRDIAAEYEAEQARYEEMVAAKRARKAAAKAKREADLQAD
ncbi:MAG: CCA tRNA nucleotidyltransferase [Schaalia hyovaginalis]|uniref:CCA tRNA nucleotidyltransferase n=1 Tax=Schaalia hyovaginalis TaxID=29316 RepID=UPI001E2F4B24|nr:CCA tRNA nucleotidyltransferase [Schaalia hyovaginalis]MCI6411893.1 CCA tRNA nucleotidyltransferase [Schaalia hyovaginalis]MCI7512962.1 CCA tRNA nucleotidyltransferase [Schaalia hyovaginalis]MDY4491675.1 CCA tRNA nucleotidyltransferase [Schaalia hyovaginalis]MDY5601730.1 CCA tRNA nucleotidyltransferase [Schaalia hyovaginalis]